MADGLQPTDDRRDQRVESSHAPSIQDQLAATQAQLRAVLDSAVELAVIGTDAAGHINIFNRGAERMLGYQAAELIGKPLAAVHDSDELTQRLAACADRPDRPGTPFELIARLADPSHPAERTWTYVRKDGGRLTVELTLTCHRTGDGKPAGYLGTAVDVTSKLALSEALAASQAQYQSLFDALPAGVVVSDFDGMVIECNRAAGDILGVPADDLLGRMAGESLWEPAAEGGRDSERRNEPALVALRTGQPQRDVMLAVKNPTGDTSWLLVNSQPVFEPGRTAPRAAITAFVDVTERQRMEQELRRSATTDRLTGLPNRAMLFDRLQKSVRRAHEDRSYRFGVLFLDFDRFKIVNDTLGHDYGDALLKGISQRLRTVLRRNDVVSVATDAAGVQDAARLGGDEFVILLEGIRSIADCHVVAERLLSVLSAPYSLGQHEVVSTASIGIVTSDISCESAEEVLRDADAAMYSAKQAGKARYATFDVAMRQLANNRMTLESDLRKALDLDQFYLDYQPIVSLDSGQVSSFEALLRWNRPSHGIVAPGDFIQVAEDTGLIVPIGERVLEQACRQLASWRRDLGTAAPTSVAVNLSRIQLMNAGLPDKLQSLLSAYALDPHSLHLEVTESTVMRDAQTAARTIKRLRSMGVRVAMDDFGTGHSSLSCLHEFEFDVLKIDRSFISNLSRGRDFAALVHAIVTLARNLGITVVAEGIETPEQLMLLQSLDCQFGQGFHFSKPLRAAIAGQFHLPPPRLSGAA